jgi:hypothetical protein
MQRRGSNAIKPTLFISLLALMLYELHYPRNKPEASQPLAGGYARNERHHRIETEE